MPDKHARTTRSAVADLTTSVVEGARRGDPADIERVQVVCRVVVAHYSRIRGVHDPARHSDAASDAACAALLYLFRADNPTPASLARTIDNSAQRSIRPASRVKEVPFTFIRAGTEEGYFNAIVDRGPLPEDLVQRDELAECLHRVLSLAWRELRLKNPCYFEITDQVFIRKCELVSSSGRQRAIATLRGHFLASCVRLAAESPGDLAQVYTDLHTVIEGTKRSGSSTFTALIHTILAETSLHRPLEAAPDES